MKVLKQHECSNFCFPNYVYTSLRCGYGFMCIHATAQQVNNFKNEKEKV